MITANFSGVQVFMIFTVSVPTHRAPVLLVGHFKLTNIALKIAVVWLLPVSRAVICMFVVKHNVVLLKVLKNI